MNLKREKAAAIESIRAWKQGDADADEILRVYGNLIMVAIDAIQSLTKAPPIPWSPMGFNQLCQGCTDDERKKLARYLAVLRMEETLALATPLQNEGERS